MKQSTEIAGSRHVIESTTYPELQERLISLITQEIEDWNKEHPEFFAKLMVPIKFSIRYNKEFRFAARRKLIIRIIKRDELFVPRQHRKICNQLVSAIHASVVKDYFYEGQNPNYIIQGARQKTGMTFDLIPKGHIELAEQKIVRPIPTLELNGKGSYESVQKLMLTNMRGVIKVWNNLPHKMRAEIVVPENFSFDPDKQSDNSEDNSIKLRITKKGDKIKRMNRMVDYKWATYLVTGIEATGSLMFMHCDDDQKMIKNKMKVLQGVEFKFRPNGYIRFSDQK